MPADDDLYRDDEDSPGSEGAGDELAGPAEAKPAGIRNWLAGKRGWLLIIALALAQTIFGLIMLSLRSEGRPMAAAPARTVQDLAVEMLGHEVSIKDIHQSIPARGGKRISIAMEVVLILGQLPEERVEGALRPTPEEFDQFIAAIQAMEPRIRSRLNSLLQSIPPDKFGNVEVARTIKEDLKKLVNDGLNGLDFGKTVRAGIDKRRVTDVLLPVFLRQTSG